MTDVVQIDVGRKEGAGYAACAKTWSRFGRGDVLTLTNEQRELRSKDSLRRRRGSDVTEGGMRDHLPNCFYVHGGQPGSVRGDVALISFDFQERLKTR